MDSLIPSSEVELLEAAAWAELHGHFGLKSGDDAAVVKRWGGATALASRIADVVAINRAIGFGFERPLGGDQLSEVRAFYREQGKARWFVECSPHATIDPAALAAAGGVLGGFQIKLVGALEELRRLPPAKIEVREAGADDASRFMDIVGAHLGVPDRVRAGIVATIGEPGWHFYFAVVDNRPVAGAAMFVRAHGAWLGLAATLPEYRCLGAQSALLLRRTADAKAAGCRWISAETAPESAAPNPSLRNMKRLGLRELYHRPWYRFHEDAPILQRGTDDRLPNNHQGRSHS